jgi:hypothetical protein
MDTHSDPLRAMALMPNERCPAPCPICDRTCWSGHLHQTIADAEACNLAELDAERKGDRVR